MAAYLNEGQVNQAIERQMSTPRCDCSSLRRVLNRALMIRGFMDEKHKSGDYETRLRFDQRIQEIESEIRIALNA